MYAPCARNSFAKVCSTKLILPVTFFALSFGTVQPQLTHCTVPEDPLPPFVRPLLARLSGMKSIKSASLYSCMVCYVCLYWKTYRKIGMDCYDLNFEKMAYAPPVAYAIAINILDNKIAMS